MISRELSWRVWICLIFVQGLGIHQALAAGDDAVPGSRYMSARGSALGDAFLPLGDDGPAALFYNPAVAAKIRSTQAEPLNFSMQANGGFTDALGLDSYKVYSLSSNLSQLQATPGAYQGGGVSLLPSFYGKGFAIGILMQDIFEGSSDASGNATYRSLYQFIPAASYGVRLAGGIVRLGYSVQWVNEAVGNISVPAGTTPLGYNQNLLQGSGISQMAGFALTLPVAYLPQFDLVARNIGGTTYSMPSIVPIAQNSTGAPATEPMSVDASFSLQPKIDSGVYANFVLELRDVTDTSNIATAGRLATGLELSIRDFFYLRCGWGGWLSSRGRGL